MTSPILDLHDITVTYPDGTETITALDRARLEAHGGTMTAVVGESGSGKSTLLAVAGGLTVPDSGRAAVAGERLDGASDAERTRIRREHIGFIFQNPGLIGAMNVRDQLLVTDHLRGRSLRRDRAEQLLDAVGLADHADRRITELSGGQRQRVGIARALMASPELLLADEPTSALDAERSRSVLELLRSLVDDLNLACVVVTHDRSNLQMFDEVVEVIDGRATAISTVAH
ncbi:ABC transporter ATP-binding protein [Corynebacterium yudongzhengii]|uniref:ABC transporter ATP-binding protein n=1 Tax=Corynebacterium yudongzhengii TaxID=2080740 RepID=A0A2U1T431_9CORY|nr:ABC transporter ATP-binding protein [Corynebacterium yudongzhengii]AWB82846.1 ABC transporter ATP-binding protein [Corynebacterium yudongzhengii]PWC00751.1 ABC transporter ATP-binding protein [Corynebacterium yudongzhengii]